LQEAGCVFDRSECGDAKKKVPAPEGTRTSVCQRVTDHYTWLNYEYKGEEFAYWLGQLDIRLCPWVTEGILRPCRITPRSLNNLSK
jgi:hypothetical protein